MNSATAVDLAKPTPSTLIPLDKLVESPFNHRRTWGDLGELAKSIGEVGVLEDLLARPHPKKAGAYELVFGHRRLRAAKLAKLSEVPCKVRELSDAQAVEVQCIENLQREDVHPLEEAEGYEQLMRLGKMTAEDVAGKIGKSRSYVFGRLKLLALCDKVRKAFVADEISASVALYVARIPDEKLQLEALEAVKGNQWDAPMSARAAQEEIESKFMLRLEQAPFDRGDGTMPGGACATCPKRTGNQKELFADVKSADVCTDPGCFKAKVAEHGKRIVAAAKAKTLPVLQGDEASKAISQAQSYASAKVDLDKVAYEDPKRRTYRELLGKGSLELKATIAVDSDGRAHELVARGDVAKALKGKVRLEREERASPGLSAAARNAEQKRRAEMARKRAKTAAVLVAVVAAAEKKVEGTAFWPFLAKLLAAEASHDAATEVCKRRAISVPKTQYGGGNPAKAIVGAIPKMTPEQAKGLAVELLAGAGAFFYHSDGLGNALLTAASYYKVDANKVGAEALAAAAKSKPAKASAKKPKGNRP